MSADSFCLDYSWDADGDEPPNLCLKPLIAALATAMEENDFELSILFTSDERVRLLNREYRAKDQTTDVLSFSQPTGQPGLGLHHLGDIVISVPRARQQAEEIGQDLVIELRFLVLHGFLHLLGYDHESDDGEMMALQGSLKLQLGQFF